MNALPRPAAHRHPTPAHTRQPPLFYRSGNSLGVSSPIKAARRIAGRGAWSAACSSSTSLLVPGSVVSTGTTFGCCAPEWSLYLVQNIPANSGPAPVLTTSLIFLIIGPGKMAFHSNERPREVRTDARSHFLIPSALAFYLQSETSVRSVRRRVRIALPSPKDAKEDSYAQH
jgi:hypothetical protein